jgi:hypothetical protein
MQARVAAIERLFSTDDERKQLWQVHDIVHYANNSELHPSSWSLARAARRMLQPDGREMLQLRVGREPDLASVALGTTWWVYRQLLGLVHQVFELPLEALHELAKEADGVF